MWSASTQYFHFQGPRGCMLFIRGWAAHIARDPKINSISTRAHALFYIYNSAQDMGFNLYFHNRKSKFTKGRNARWFTLGKL